MTLTRDLAYAAGLDAGNRSMRKAGRHAWNEDDYAAACDVTNKLLDMLSGAPAPCQESPT